MIYYSVNFEFADYKYKIAHFLLYYKHFSFSASSAFTTDYLVESPVNRRQ